MIFPPRSSNVSLSQIQLENAQPGRLMALYRPGFFINIKERLLMEIELKSRKIFNKIQELRLQKEKNLSAIDQLKASIAQMKQSLLRTRSLALIGNTSEEEVKNEEVKFDQLNRTLSNLNSENEIISSALPILEGERVEALHEENKVEAQRVEEQIVSLREQYQNSFTEIEAAAWNLLKLIQHKNSLLGSVSTTTIYTEGAIQDKIRYGFAEIKKLFFGNEN